MSDATTTGTAQSVTRTVRVGASVGLHARPAAAVVKAAGDLPTPVTIAVPGKPPADARSMLSILALGAGPGAEVELAASGPEAQAAVDALAAVIAAGDEDA